MNAPDALFTTDAPCWHCGTPVGAQPVPAKTPEGPQPACCHGCAAAIEGIHQLGLGDYYRFRTDAGRPPDTEARDDQALAPFTVPELLAGFIETQENGQTRLTLRIEGLHCAACVWLIEHGLTALPGVEAVRLNLASARLTVTYDAQQVTPLTLARRLRQLGYRACLPTREGRVLQARAAYRQMLRRLLVAGLCSMQAMMYSTALYVGTFDDVEAVYAQLFRLTSFIVATPAIFYSGWPFFSGAWYALRARTLTMDVPVALALALAWTGSVVALVRGVGHIYFESLAMFVFFLLISRWLEQRQKLRSAEAHSQLSDSLPAVARRKIADTDTWQTIASHLINPGDCLSVQQGELIPVDATVTDGEALVEEALLTGEAVPVKRVAGEAVLAGARVLEGHLVMQAQGSVRDSMVARLGQLLDISEAEESRLHLYARHIVPWFIGGVLGLAVFTLWWHRDAGLDLGLQYALAVLVVTCPCALALAAPLAVSAARSRALAEGVLIARPMQLLALAEVDRAVFDKTGTLTEGRFSVQAVRHLDERWPEHTLLGVAAGLERHASHPLAKAIAALAPPVPVDAFTQVRQGVSGIAAGETWALRAASAALLSEQDPAGTAVALYRQNADASETPVMLFFLADCLRPDAAEALQKLHQQGITTMLASGDRDAAVQHVAAQLPISDARGAQTPEQKLAWITELQRLGHRVLMTGDGINDARSLAAADCAIAMADSSALARDAAGIYLLRQNLLALPWLQRLSCATHRTLRVNIAWALGYNLLAIPFAVAGLIPPWLAAIGMSASSLLVSWNAGRLRSWK
ncbi:cadmium-translocating P-type ATPase [Alcanivorax sp. JB21]|uniref:heavy metal translocating P-type ATPase n=1 Tax=Alcanivorax limicola TaxID=2874102 RepID=UPI001CC0E873|nr:heavy metal translocating P-type ATPase [Alcanivorax limicola]MBZ2187891.1 cadmium-translocating P-type ATPase [Alcanivorax limicola]